MARSGCPTVAGTAGPVEAAAVWAALAQRPESQQPASDQPPPPSNPLAELTLETALRVPCGPSAHEVTLLCTAWGTIQVLFNPCADLPPAYRTLSRSDCDQHLGQFCQAYERLAQFVWCDDVPCGTDLNLFADAGATAVGDFLLDLTVDRGELAEQVWRQVMGESPQLESVRAALDGQYGHGRMALMWSAVAIAGTRRWQALAGVLSERMRDWPLGLTAAGLWALNEMATPALAATLSGWAKCDRFALELRRRTIETLGRIGDETTLDDLLRTIEGDCQPDTGAVASKLWVPQSSGDAPLRDAARQAMVAVIQRLAERGPLAAGALLRMLRPTRVGRIAGDAYRAAQQALVRFGAAALDQWIPALATADADLREGAIDTLAMLGRVAAPRLVEILETAGLVDRLSESGRSVGQPDSESQATSAAHAAHSRLRSGAAETPSARSVAQPDSESQAAGAAHARLLSGAAEALGRMGWRDAVPALLRAFAAPDRTVQEAAAGALGRIGDARAIDSLFQALRSDVAAASGSALIAIFDRLQRRDLALVPKLVHLLTRDSWLAPDVCRAVARALHRMGDPRGLAALLERIRRQPESATGDLAAAAQELMQLHGPNGAFAVEVVLCPLQADLIDVIPDVAAQSIQMLAAQGGTAALPPLLAALRARHPAPRLTAVAVLLPLMRSLAQQQGPAAVPVLGQAVHAAMPDDRVAVAAVEALQAIDDPATVSALIPALGSSSSAVQRAAVRALIAKTEQLRPHGVAGLAAIESLSQVASEDVTLAAIRALVQHDNDRVRAALKRAALCGAWPSLRQEAAAALGRRGDPREVQRLLRVLQAGDVRATSGAVAMLVAIGRPAVPALLKAMKYQFPEARIAAAGALGQIGDAAALDVLNSALRDPSLKVRAAAQSAIRQIQLRGGSTT